jgi:hypothetical protein
MFLHGDLERQLQVMAWYHGYSAAEVCRGDRLGIEAAPTRAHGALIGLRVPTAG